MDGWWEILQVHHHLLCTFPSVVCHCGTSYHHLAAQCGLPNHGFVLLGHLRVHKKEQGVGAKAGSHGSRYPPEQMCNSPREFSDMFALTCAAGNALSKTLLILQYISRTRFSKWGKCNIPLFNGGTFSFSQTLLNFSKLQCYDCYNLSVRITWLCFHEGEIRNNFWTNKKWWCHITGRKFSAECQTCCFN